MSGIINISKLKIPPERHELMVAKVFSELGYDVDFIAPSNIPDIHTPDIKMNGVEWEIKSPKGKGKHTIERNVSNALLQSKNIIFDLSRINIPEDICISLLKREFEVKNTIKQLYIVKRDKSVVLLSRK